PDYVQPLVDLQTPPAPYLNCLAAITVPAEAYSELPVETVIQVGEETLPLILQVGGPGAMPLDPQLFSLELWEYPYAVARFYHIPADQLFGPEHERLTKENLQKYSAMGGHSITTTIVEDPWHHQTYDAYPSLVQWTRAADGFHFDYTNFDRMCSGIWIWALTARSSASQSCRGKTRLSTGMRRGRGSLKSRQ
ncbi:MAG: hypothetical protein LKI45_07095, partial [Schleiferilactobacillus harbinensis]|nr:hypothetical protein [Schleiferilactobacillus harbinensis]